MNTKHMIIEETKNRVSLFLTERNQPNRGWSIPHDIWTINDSNSQVTVVFEPYGSDSYTVIRFTFSIENSKVTLQKQYLLIDGAKRRSYKKIEDGVRAEVQQWLASRGEADRPFTVENKQLNGQWEVVLSETETHSAGTIWLYAKPVGGYNPHLTGGLFWIAAELNESADSPESYPINPISGNRPKGTIPWNMASHPQSDPISVDALIAAFSQLLQDDFLFRSSYGQEYVDQAIALVQEGKILRAVMHIFWAIRTHARGFQSSSDEQILALFKWANDFYYMETPQKLGVIVDWGNPYMRISHSGFPNARLYGEGENFYRTQHLDFKEGVSVLILETGIRQVTKDDGYTVRWTSYMGYIPPFPANVGVDVFTDWFNSFPQGSDNPYQDTPITYRG